MAHLFRHVPRRGLRLAGVAALTAALVLAGIPAAQAAPGSAPVYPVDYTAEIGDPVVIGVTCPDAGATGLRWHGYWNEGQTTVIAAGSPVLGGVRYDITAPTSADPVGGWIQSWCQYGPDLESSWSEPFYFMVLKPSSTTVLEVTASATTPGTVTGRVMVTGSRETPTGTALVRVGGAAQPNLTLVDGTATFEVSGLAEESVDVSAAYLGSGTYEQSASPTVPIRLRSRAYVTIETATSAYAGVPFEIAARVESAGTRAPTGTVTFTSAEGTLGTAEVVDGRARLQLVRPSGLLSDIAASYAGDGWNTAATTWTPGTQWVGPAPQPVVTVTAPTSGDTDGVQATVQVDAFDTGLPVPAGDVQLIVHAPGEPPVAAVNGTLVDGAVTLATGTLPAGTYRLLAHYSGGAGSMFAQADSADQELVVAAAPGTGTPPGNGSGTPPGGEPQPGNQPPPGSQPQPGAPSPSAPDPVLLPGGVTAGPQVSLSASLILAGADITVVASGFAPGEMVSLVLHSDPLLLGSVRADADGVARLTATVPMHVPAGVHRVVATGASSGRTASATVTLQAPAPRSAGVGDQLARTGAGLADLGALGGVVLLAGAVLMAAARRRHPALAVRSGAVLHSARRR